MPTKNTRITFAVSDEMDRRIDDFQYEQRCKNKTQAILQLLQNGLEVLSPKSKKDSAGTKQNLSDLDKRIISLLPLVPENVKEALLLLCEATCVPETAESLAADPEVDEVLCAALAEHTGDSESAEERKYS